MTWELRHLEDRINFTEQQLQGTKELLCNWLDGHHDELTELRRAVRQIQQILINEGLAKPDDFEEAL